MAARLPSLADPVTRAEQRAEVAALASRLFGTVIPAGNIVGEPLLIFFGANLPVP